MFDRYEIIDGSDMINMVNYVLGEYELSDQFTSTYLVKRFLEAIFLGGRPDGTSLLNELTGYVDDEVLDELTDRLKDYVLRLTLALRTKMSNDEYISGLTVTFGGDVIFSVEDEKVVNEEVKRLADQHEEERSCY